MKTRGSIALAVLILFALTLAGCAASATPAQEGTQPAVSSGTSALEGTQWKLASYITAEQGYVDVLPGTEITTWFKRADMGGSGGCNDYAGIHTASGEELTVKAAGTTVNTCSEELMAQDKVFLGDLNRAASYKIVGKKLEIFDDEGLLLLTYSARLP